MNKPWNGWSDYTDRLPEHSIRAIEPVVDLSTHPEPHVDVPEWVEGVLAALVVAIAIAVVLASILSAPVLSR